MNASDRLAEVAQLTVAWRAALDARERHPNPPDWMDAEEQRAYDELIDFVEANGLNYTEHDPRGCFE